MTPDPPDGRASVLVVEDEEHIRELVCLHLGLEGYRTIAVGDGRTALEVSARQPLDLVVLDLMIPGLDGVTVCRAIRRGGSNTDVPILMLTARREEADKVVGLESGADDYLTKPFGVRELVARVRALMRRPRGPAQAPGPVENAPVAPGPAPDGFEAVKVIRVHGVEIDPARRRVLVEGREAELTSQEFRLLHLLASHPGIVFSREALLARVWKSETHVTIRSVDTLVRRLRKKIDRGGASSLIVTIWGAGYKFPDV